MSNNFIIIFEFSNYFKLININFEYYIKVLSCILIYKYQHIFKKNKLIIVKLINK